MFQVRQEWARCVIVQLGRNPLANVTPAVELATWLVTARLALLKRRLKRVLRRRMPLPQQAKAPRVFASSSIAGVLISDALIDTGSAFSILISAMYSRLRDAPAI